MITNPFEPWWKSKEQEVSQDTPTEKRYDPIVGAQRLLQPMPSRPPQVSTEQEYAKLEEGTKYTRPDGKLATKGLVQEEPFDAEGSGYDMESAKSVGMKPTIDPEDGLPHYGSVIETTKEQQEQYGLPEESYMILKGKQHDTWDLAVKGEEDRGFKIEKHGDRYFSVPQEAETQGVKLDEEPIQEKLIYDDRLTTDDTTKPKAEALSNEEFINDWGKTYQTDNDPVKNKAALKRLNSFDGDIKPEATTAMQVAGAIFDGDKNVTSDQIIDYLTKVGIVESNFSTKKQKGNGPARSYWQVEPATALDLSKNSKAFFGNKFNTAFKKYAKDGETAIESLSKMSKEEIGKLLLDDDRLAASFAAAKYIATR